MNVKLKALLIAIAYVAMPFLFMYTVIMYPLVVLFAALTLIVWLIYNKVLYDLENERQKKNGCIIKEFNDE